MKNEDRFTERARRVLEMSQEAASGMGHAYVGSEHILLAIAREGDGPAAKVLRDNGIEAEMIEELVERRSGRGIRERFLSRASHRGRGGSLRSRLLNLCGWGTTTSAPSISSWGY